MSRRRLWVLLGIVVATLTWQALQRPRPAAPEAVSAITGAAGTAEVWQLGQLQLHACDIGARRGGTVRAWCARFDVPEDWQQLQGRRISLRVAVVRSDAAAPADDLVTFLDGGPGGAATEDYPGYAAAFSALRRRHHLLLVDQRGTGGSNALNCQEGEPDTASLPDPAQLEQGLQRCLDKLRARAEPRFYTTTEATRDLEAVRLALGGPVLNLVGVSYGTRVAQQYATRYPHAVRSVVLDSAVPNELMLGADHARNLETTLQAYFAECAAQPACRTRYGDPYASMQKLHRQLRQAPQRAAGRDPLSFTPLERTLSEDEFTALLRLYAYSPLTASLLPLMIDQALQGNFSPLLGQAQLLFDSVTERLTDGMGLSVACAEDVAGLRVNPADAQTLLGTGLVEFLIKACAIWPRGSMPADFHQAFTSTLPVLVLAGERDPVTPPRYAETVIANLPGARLLRLKGQGHAVMGVGCMPRLVAEFVQQLDAHGLDARCLDTLGPTPSFVDYNGADP